MIMHWRTKLPYQRTHRTKNRRNEERRRTFKIVIGRCPTAAGWVRNTRGITEQRQSRSRSNKAQHDAL